MALVIGGTCGFPTMTDIVLNTSASNKHADDFH